MTTIAIPDNPFYNPLVSNAEAIAPQYELRIIRTSESQCTRLLQNNTADLALLSPLGYGSGVVASDYRCIPTNLCILKGWTNTAAIFFRSGLESITTLASPTPEDFLLRAGMIVLGEQFDTECQIETVKGSVEELLKSYDAVLSWRTGNEAAYEGMDISEEWEMAFDAALPLALWVCRAEVGDEAPLWDITQAMADSSLPEQVECVEEHPFGDTFARAGEIQWKWNASTEEIINQNLQMLFYHQLVPQIPAVKILGRD